MNFRNLIGHIKTVLVHKKWVFYYCCKLGIPWQGLWHDMSKFSWTELKESVWYYQGGKGSPIPIAKESQGYSLAWQHHKGRNPHHYEYWTDNYDSGTTCIRMPWNYFLEMVADYLAAGRTYQGKNFTFKSEDEWWQKKAPSCKMNETTKAFLTEVFCQLKWLEQIEGHSNVFLSKEYFRRLANRYESVKVE